MPRKSKTLPPEAARLVELIDLLRQEKERRFALAELDDVLVSLASSDFGVAVASIDVRHLDPLMQNYVAAMVEQASAQKEQSAPAWTRDVVPLAEPWFATRLPGLRMHLLLSSPVPFKRRNIFIDSGVGWRV